MRVQYYTNLKPKPKNFENPKLNNSVDKSVDKG